MEHICLYNIIIIFLCAIVIICDYAIVKIKEIDDYKSILNSGNKVIDEKTNKEKNHVIST